LIILSNVSNFLGLHSCFYSLNYLYRQFPKLCVYLENGKLNIDNNQAENHIRPIAVGRKNWLFATSTKGATALANWYSIIESAKINKLDPFTYLKHIFTELPLYEKENRSLEPLLPWNIVIN
jgi:transposase